MEEPLGEHFIIELYDCNRSILNDEEKIATTLLRAADVSGATIIDSKFHKFSPQGVSGVVIIAESHLSIHTWPEHGYAALDFFTCGSTTNMDAAMELFHQTFQPGNVELKRLSRGLPGTLKTNQQRSQHLESLPT